MILTAVAVSLHVLRFFHAGPLWRDEIAALNLARMPWKELLEYFEHEAFPLLFPITVRGYVSLAGPTDVALRFCGFAAGIACLAVLWVNARLLRQLPPLISIVLIGFNPLFFVWGDSLRGYGIGAALIMLTFGMFARTIALPAADVGMAGRPMRGASLAIWIGCLCSALLSVQYLVGNWILLFAIGCAAALVHFRSKRWRSGIFVLLIGWLAAVSVLHYIDDYYTGRNWDVIFRSNTGLRSLVAHFLSALAKPNWTMLGLWIAATVIFAGALGLISLRRRDMPISGVSMFAALTAGFATVGSLLLLRFLRYPEQAWYYIALIALLAVALETGIGALAPLVWWIRPTRLIAACLAVVTVVTPAFKIASTRMTNMDLVARELENRAGRDDMILVLPWFFGISFAAKYHSDTTWQTVPKIADLRVHRYDLLKDQLTSAQPLAPVFEQAAKTLQAGHRLWLVGDPRFPGPNDTVAGLAPAPNSTAGWNESAYRWAWLMQIGSFVNTHGGNVRELTVKTDQLVNPFEKARIVEVEGWR